MRIIAGELKGQQFSSPHGHKTHPMSDKVRGALFNVLGDVKGLTVLDAFTGTGALAFEAASRGAKIVIAIDKDNAAHRVVEQNTKDLRLQKKVKVSRANTGGWSIHNMETEFDIVLLDPPYDDIQPNLLTTLAIRHAKPYGLVVVSLPPKVEFKLDDSRFKLEIEKNYGDARLAFYRKVK